MAHRQILKQWGKRFDQKIWKKELSDVFFFFFFFKINSNKYILLYLTISIRELTDLKESLVWTQTYRIKHE